MTSTRHGRLIGAVTVLIAAIGVILVAAASGGRSAPAHAELDVHSGLLVSDRSEFRICVQLDPASGADRATIGGQLLAALDRVRAHPDWATAYQRASFDASRVLEWDCPGARLPQPGERPALAGPGATAEPSPYRIWIYVLGEPTGDRVLGPDRAAGIATAELMRAGQSSFPVSTALLIRAGELARPSASGFLGEAAGLA